MAISEESAKDLGAESMEKKTKSDTEKPRSRMLIEFYEMRDEVEETLSEAREEREDAYPVMPSVEYCEGAAAVASLFLNYFEEKGDRRMNEYEEVEFQMRLQEIVDLANFRRRKQFIEICLLSYAKPGVSKEEIPHFTIVRG